MKRTKPILHHSKTHMSPKAKMSKMFRMENTQNSLMLAKRPLFSAARNLIKSPSGGFSSSGALSAQENLLENLHAPAEPSAEHTPAENHVIGDDFQGEDLAANTTVPEKTTSENTAHKNPSAAGSAVTAFNLMPTATRKREAPWEHPNMGSDSPPQRPHLPSALSPR